MVSRIINEPVVVHLDTGTKVTAFIWRRRLYRVKGILSWWREPSQWWQEKPVRLLVRVTAANRNDGIYELCRMGADWSLHRIFD